MMMLFFCSNTILSSMLTLNLTITKYYYYQVLICVDSFIVELEI